VGKWRIKHVGSSPDICNLSILPTVRSNSATCPEIRRLRAIIPFFSLVFMNIKLITLVLLFFGVLPVHAAQISSLTGIRPGSIGNGNGYFDNEADYFDMSSDANVFLVSERGADGGVWIMEPVGYSMGRSSIAHLITGKVVWYATVASDGYIYFIDNTSIRRKNTRGSTAPISSISTSDATTIDSFTAGTYPGITPIIEIDGYVYYLDGNAQSVKRFSLSDLVVSTVYTGLQPISDTVTMRQFFSAFAPLNSTAFLYSTISHTPGTGECVITIRQADASSKTAAINSSSFTGSCVDSSTINTTLFVSPHYWGYDLSPGTSNQISNVFYRNNAWKQTFLPTGGTYRQITQNVWVGGKTNVLLYADNTYYNTYSFLETGSSNEQLVPPDIIYTTATIASKYGTYYNSSQVRVDYDVYIDTGLFSGQFWLLPLDYRWEIDLIDPEGVIIDTTVSPACSVNFFTCSVNYSLIYVPRPYWAPGAWSAKLYEKKNSNTLRALIATSAPWTILNASQSANATKGVVPTTAISSGSGVTALTSIDGWTALFGLGVNAISKFLFAMVIIVIFMIIGCLLTRGELSGAVILGVLPYMFFTFIEYLPAWAIIILGIVVAIKIGFFR
jgi:hypothetical protein